MPEPDAALSSPRHPLDPNAAAVAESPDRSAPILQMPNGDLPRDIATTLDASHERVSEVRRFAREGAVEMSLEDDVTISGAASDVSAEAQASSDLPDPVREHAQTVRRVQEFSGETRGERAVREWDGAEHEGTVVAADAEGIVMHLGRHEFMHVPADAHALDRQIVGKLAAVDRSGRISDKERDADQRSLDGLDRGHR
jgi:hypothetical protein